MRRLTTRCRIPPLTERAVLVLVVLITLLPAVQWQRFDSILARADSHENVTIEARYVSSFSALHPFPAAKKLCSYQAIIASSAMMDISPSGLSSSQEDQAAVALAGAHVRPRAPPSLKL
jgi:hypothetical protein